MAYDSNFLSFNVPLPALGNQIQGEAFAGGQVFDYRHHSLIFNEKRKLAFLTAHNIDGTRRVGGVRRKDSRWKLDDNIPHELQVGVEAYDNNVWDKGHLVRREAIVWGASRAEALQAQHDSFLYTNAAPQHGNFNQDEWLELEDYVLRHAKEENYKIAVFTGPVFTDFDLPIGEQSWEIDVRVPMAFWKVAVLNHVEHGKVATGFLMPQQHFWADKDNGLIDLSAYQVSLRLLERKTGLDFGVLNEWDPLRGHADDETLEVSSTASGRRPYIHNRVPELRAVQDGSIRFEVWNA